MCWVSSNPPKLQVAAEDIKVYKILVKIDKDIFSPLYKMLWHCGEKYMTRIGNPYKIFGSYAIFHGFHSLRSVPHISRGHWVTNNNTYIFPYSSDELVFECTIPKGASYYENEDGKIVSDTSIINRLHEE